MSGKFRARLIRMGGVNIKSTKNDVFIGEHVIFDTNYPEMITIERGVYITAGCVILTHYLDSDLLQESVQRHKFSPGKVYIKENAFIGCNTVVCKAVTIGKNAIVGASSVVTKDIPDNEIWAGNPARFIKKRLNKKLE